MELYIETLTGAAFELRVSPFETIMSVKAKIQRLEGIPISQQHLIWQSVELEDDYCLHDYSIHDGATLKLVLAMRGGPINTRRVPMEDPALREMAEYMEANREEIWEKLPGNKQVTLLVFREGDQLNFFRVVDRGDGTLTPLSESLSGGSVCNVYEEEEEVEEAPSQEKLEENEATKEKMQVLRSKMENMSLTKKPKKKLVPRPPSSGRPGSRSKVRRLTSAGRSSSKGQIINNSFNLNSSLNKNMCLPPVGYSVPGEDLGFLPATLGPELSMTMREASTSSLSGSEPMSANRLHRLDSVESSAKLKRSLSSVKEDLSISRPGSGNGRHQKVVQRKPHYAIDTLDSEQAGSAAAAGSAAVSSVASTSTHVQDYTSFDAALKDWCCQTYYFFQEERNHAGQPEGILRTPGPAKHRERTWSKDFSSHDLFDSLGRPTTSSRSKEKFTLDNFKESLGRPTTTSRHPSHERKKEFTLESLSSSEARAMSGLLRQASLERLGSSRISNFVHSPTKPRTSAYGKEGRVLTPEGGRLVSARLQQKYSANGERLSPTTRLPPVKSKKKVSKRCFMCAKKTGLATSYPCRCGNNFCSIHRYAEAHDCTFDYKTEGRKLLEQSNPVVSAPKLPKI
ncbi:LOW QUALITY PROTEIN: AN1-type zinc finger protein 4-like [Lingula anatina]|uniref:LOW QUALITY PROTEIN: AN1-type zinc finger protein 4-like n=1 Tax=Lingula anatina TaxID=7574 RepID=A0A1S3IHJ9_LINAN|nr:LOW QUALITY PROTEIN: AN1-type zinc finger protein 4-like [Lingula anatina]|eukprot:XP_013397692.1 LOW QUALITY PROTEIN: AN1-type zinc finger protein 4-like [Lingula anatina]